MPLFKFSINEGIDGSVIVPLLQAYGEATQVTIEIDGDVSIPILSVMGGSWAEIDGDVTIRVVSVSGRIDVLYRTIGGAVTIPSCGISGDMCAEGVVLLAPLRVHGRLTTQGEMDGDIVIRCLAVSGSVTKDNPIFGAVNIPVLRMGGSMVLAPSALDGGIEIPLILIAGAISTQGSFDFGNEDDSVLRFSSARRYI